MPGQALRQKKIRLKLSTVCSEFKGKNVLLIDDSIVRGSTSIELIQMARDAGAKKVYFASAAPPVRFPNFYGIDIPTRNELVAFNRSEDEVAEFIGADKVIYNNLEDLEDAIKHLNPDYLKTFDTSCFSGKYVTSEVTPEYVHQLESRRGLGRVGAVQLSITSPSTARIGCSSEYMESTFFEDDSMDQPSKRQRAVAKTPGSSTSCEPLHNNGSPSKSKPDRRNPAITAI
jgi:hypothetical protein